ncbi:MAG: CcmD family protein [Bacteroidetes bacterium]|nr:CcmD family protein [Bacteroidota bacterium]
MKRLFYIIILMILSVTTKAQEAEPADITMAEKMRESGLIYVVVMVLVTIFLGIILYLFRLDRKISKLEKKSDELK